MRIPLVAVGLGILGTVGLLAGCSAGSGSASYRPPTAAPTPVARLGAADAAGEMAFAARPGANPQPGRAVATAPAPADR